MDSILVSRRKGVNMIIAVDFDGTVVEHKFPEIGDELPGAIYTLRALQKAGHYIIIWTCRNLTEPMPFYNMIDWFRSKRFEPDNINSNYPLLTFQPSPKIYADIYIDDRNFGGFPGWDKIRKDLLNEK